MWKKIIKSIIIILLISLFIEIFICNSLQLASLFVSKKNVNMNYKIQQNIEEKYRKLSDEADIIQENNNDYDKKTKKENIIEYEYIPPLSQSQIIIDNIGFELCNIRIKYKQDYEGIVFYNTQAYIYGNEANKIEFPTKYMKANKDNTYINIRTESKANKIVINVLNYADKELEIEGITCNEFRLNINIVRILIIFVVIFSYYIIRKNNIYKVEYVKENKKHNIFYYEILAIIILLITIYASNNLFKKQEDIFRVMPERNDRMLLQAYSFLNGKIEMVKEPSQDLKELSNPYDNSLRASEDIPFLWDVSYYKGNYYLYFTPIMILLVMIPFKLITGYYITTATVNTFLLALAIFLIGSLFKKLVDRYITHVKLFNLILGMTSVIVSSGIFLLVRGMCYEVAELCGINSLLGTILLILSIEKSDKHKGAKLILAGITTAFIVISKPTYIFWYILILPIIIKLLHNQNKQKEKVEFIKEIIAYIIPIIFIAIWQMIYNYARYDNILEFGAKYQLTIYDMRYMMTISVQRIFKGIIKYLFLIPEIDFGKFPFIYFLVPSEEIKTGMGIISFETVALGLFVVPIYWVLLYKNKILSDTKDTKLKLITNIVIVISFAIMIANTVFAGIVEQYSIQYKVMLAIISVLLLLKALEKEQISNRTFLIMCIVSIIIVLPISLSTLSFWLKYNYEFINYFKNLFEFWS